VKDGDDMKNTSQKCVIGQGRTRIEGVGCGNELFIMDGWGRVTQEVFLSPDPTNGSERNWR